MGLGETAGILLHIKADASNAEANIKRFTNSLLADAHSIGEEGLQSLGSFGGGLTALEGPAGIAALALGGVVAVSVELGEKLFAVTEKAAEYGNSIFEASEKTGLGAETLSALKAQADVMGVSFEKVQNGITKFTLLMGDAAKGSDGAKEKLKALHVTATDLGEGFAQAVKYIAQLPEGIQQNTAAGDAFGKKFGKELIPYIKEFKGDIPGLIEHFQKLGLTMNDETARQAHEFEVQMRLLGAQFSAVERTLGQELMPTFLRASKDISSWLAENRGEFVHWGSVIAVTVGDAVRGLERVVQFVEDHKTAFRIAAAIGTAGLSEGALAAFNALDQQAAKYNAGTKGASEGGTRPVEGGYTDAFNAEQKDAAEKAAKEREEIAKRDAAAQTEILKKQLEDAKALYEKTLNSLREAFKASGNKELFEQGIIASAKTYSESVGQILVALTDAEGKQNALAKKTAKELELTAQEQRDRVRKILDEEQKATSDNKKLIAEKAKAIDQKSAEDQKAIMESQLQTTLKRYENELQIKAITEVEFLTKTSREKLSVLNEELKLEKDVTKQSLIRQEITRENLNLQSSLITIEQKRRDEERRFQTEALKWYQDQLDAIEKRIAAEDEEAAKLRIQKAEQKREDDRSVLDRGLHGIGGASVPSTIDSTGTVKKQADFLKQVYQDLKNMSGQAIGSMIQDLGNLATQWVLTGGFSAKAALQMAAGVLMGIAIQAGVKAWFEHAEAVAAAARYDFASASLHAAAASMYLKTAGIAGGIGVGVGITSRFVGGGQSAQGSYNGATGQSSQPDYYTNPQAITRTGAPVNQQSSFGSLNSEVLARLADHLERLQAVPAGQVFVQGMKDAGSAVAKHVVSSVRADPAIRNSMNRGLGVV